MFQVQDTILSENIATASFACDLPKCKGACCVVGDAGAPISKGEIPNLNKAYGLLEDELHPQARKTVREEGLIQQSSDGQRISCRGSEECVFVLYGDDDVAYCAIQKAFLEGRIDWEKPVSCHLYPIRLKKIADFEYANFEYVDELCSAACAKGKQEGTYLSDFLKKALVRRYDEEWYAEFSEQCKEIRIENGEAIAS